MSSNSESQAPPESKAGSEQSEAKGSHLSDGKEPTTAHIDPKVAAQSSQPKKKGMGTGTMIFIGIFLFALGVGMAIAISSAKSAAEKEAAKVE